MIDTRSPSAGPSVDSPDGGLAVGFDDVDEGAEGRALHRCGRDTVAFCRVWTRSRMFTNWFGNSFSSLFSNSARSWIVPVVVSIWLSTVCSVPVASMVGLGAIPGLDLRPRAAAIRFEDDWQLGFRHREEHRDGAASA